MKLDSIFFMLLIGAGCTIGFMEFAIDLTASYDVSGVPTELRTSAQETIDSMNSTSNTLIEVFANRDNSWVQTSFNIFFALPVQLINTFAETATFGTTFGAAAVNSIDASGGIAIPVWVTALMFIGFAGAIVFGLWATLRM